MVLDSNGSGELGQQDINHRPEVKGEEEARQLKEELMGAFEGALDGGGPRGDLRGIRVLQSDGGMAGQSGGPCFGNCEDDEGAEWVRGPSAVGLEHAWSSLGCLIYVGWWNVFPDHIPGEASTEAQGRVVRECDRGGAPPGGAAHQTFHPRD